MFAAATLNTQSWYEHPPFNWFDLALLGLLGIGFWRGRRRGMTKELFPTMQWVTILLAVGYGHIYLADWLQQQGLIRMMFGNEFNERTAALVGGYLVIALAVVIIFTALKRKYTAKLEGSSCFGGNEYYWGVAAGLVRYLCAVLIAMALLNAPFYTAAEIQKSRADRNRIYGAGLKEFSGDFIPTVYEIQDSVFKNSLVGPLIKGNLSMLFINTLPTAKNTAHS